MPETKKLVKPMILLKIRGNKIEREISMKLKQYFFVPLCGVVALLSMTGCADDELGSNSGRPSGNGIVFGASANSVTTRTAYGDYDNPTSPTKQEILWLDKDRVEIYSPTSPSKKQVEYEVTNLEANDNGKGYLASYNGQNGLQWSSDATQSFYAVYPSPASIKNQEMVEEHKIRLENGTLYGFIPINQEYKFTRDEGSPGKWKCEPTMDWQYMAARQVNFQVPQDGTDGGITLNFTPLVTTLEITLKGPSAPLAQMNIDAPEGVKIMGEFSCDLTGQWEGTAPKCNFVQSTTTEENRVTINLYDTTGNPIKLEDGEYLTINVFLLPVQDLTNLSIRLAGYNTASRTLALNDGASETEVGTPITLPAHQKTRVTIKAPESISGTNQWMSGLTDDVYVSQLSIPGTANTFSYKYTGNNGDWYIAQTADIDKQWEAGIRCFEIKCPEVSGDLASSQVQCNRTNVGITFGDAVDEIWKKVQETVDEDGNPTEFAMIIPAYESGTGHPEDGNGVTNFMNALNTFYDKHTDYTYVTYGRDLTLGQARGGLIFVARVTSEEDEDIELAAPKQGVVVKGWGSLKDLWKRRGYDFPDWATNDNYSSSMEYLMLERNSFTMPTKGATNFYHGTVRADGTSSTQGAYVQDWNRVSPESKRYQLYSHSYQTQYCYWPESYTEKLGDVWDTFEKSIEANHNKQGDAFYINSLDGFFIDESIPLSYKPYVEGKTDSGFYWSYGYGDGGTAGNIAAFAEKINQDFFAMIQEYGPTNIYGPMNVVLLDRVYQEEDGSDPGSRLPSTIINNNFRFPLLIAPSTTTNSSDASYGEGGTVWR